MECWARIVAGLAMCAGGALCFKEAFIPNEEAEEEFQVLKNPSRDLGATAEKIQVAKPEAAPGAVTDGDGFPGHGVPSLEWTNAHFASVTMRKHNFNPFRLLPLLKSNSSRRNQGSSLLCSNQPAGCRQVDLSEAGIAANYLYNACLI